MSLQNECLVLNMYVGHWAGHRLDKTSTRKVTSEAGADADAARVNKHVLAKEAFKEITSAVSAIRTHFYKNTLPWKDNGDRVITRKKYWSFLEKHDELVGVHSAAVGNFIDTKYPMERDRAEFRMGAMFDPSDYPRPSVLRQKFFVTLEMDSVATAYDFRLSDSETVMQARITKAIQGLWHKLAKPLEHAAVTLTDVEINFHASLISNLKDICEAIPDLNFTGDQDLERFRVMVAQRIADWDVKDLRGDKNLAQRTGVGKEAQDILDQMKGFMVTMGGTEEGE